MSKLEELTRGASVKGVLPDALVAVVDVKWIGTVAVELTYKDAAGRLGSELLYRDREPTLEVVQSGRPWSFDGDGALFRLASEANRIGLAYLFDPLLAVHTSLVDPRKSARPRHSPPSGATTSRYPTTAASPPRRWPRPSGRRPPRRTGW